MAPIEWPNSYSQSFAQAAIAQAQAAAGQSKAALQTVEALPDKNARVHALSHVALGQIQAGDRKGARETLERALDFAKNLPEQTRQVHLRNHLHNLATLQARAGDFQGAVATARLIRPDAGLTFANIADVQAEAGDVKGAVETLQALRKGEWWRGNILRGIARRLAKGGKEKEAVAWARALPTSFEKGHALLGAAEGLIEPATAR